MAQPPNPRRQGIFWFGTLPENSFDPVALPMGCSWIKGQLEIGTDNGFRHWQIVVSFTKKKSLAGVVSLFPGGHWELCRSSAADAYVWKEDTRVEGTQFEHGAKPIRRNESTDWETVWELAKTGDVEKIPASIRVQSYRTLRAIGADFAKPLGMERTCNVYWGVTGSGKSRDAWAAAGLDAYPKDPRSKFWCGYRSHECVVIDEFRGGIDISHLLRWLDRYPVIVEIKGGSVVFVAKSIWITSNKDPRDWYPELDLETLNALLRRLNIVHYQ